MKLVPVVIALLCCLCIIDASHFSGGTINWYAVSGSTAGAINVTFEVRLGFFLGLGPCGPGCSTSNINMQGSRMMYALSCQAPSPCSYNSGGKGYVVTSVDTAENLEAGEESMVGVFNQSNPGPLEVGWRSSAWTQLTLLNTSNSFYRIVTTMDIGVRSDTGSMNTSPKTSLPFMARIPQGCSNVKLSIPVIDVDNDMIECRWATSSEALGIVNQLPNATIDSQNCILTINTTSYVSSGTYGVGIQIEDFPRSTITMGSNTYTTQQALSSVPLQFLVRLISGVNCNSLPVFTGNTPMAGAEVGVAVGGTVSMQITAVNMADTSSDGTITGILITAPPGLMRTNLTSIPSAGVGAGYVNITFTPTTRDTFVVCFTARDALGRASETRCVKIASGVTCQDPGQIASATRVPAATQVFLYGESVFYTCTSGQATVPGNRYRTCQIDGSWNGTAMVCSSTGTGSGSLQLYPAAVLTFIGLLAAFIKI